MTRRVVVVYVISDGVYQPALAVTQTLRIVAGPAGISVRPGPRCIA